MTTKTVLRKYRRRMGKPSVTLRFLIQKLGSIVSFATTTQYKEIHTMEDDTQISDVFDYEALDSETRLFVQRSAEAIAGQLKRTAEGVINIGQQLRVVKQRIGHGHFLAWIYSEFDMTPRSA